MSKKRAIGLKKERIPNPAKDPAQDSLHLPRRMRVPHEMTYRYIDGTSEADWCANMYFHLISSFDSLILSKDSVTRAGHAKILSRQCDHVFRPQNCYLLQYYCIYLATPCRRRNLNIFSNFFLSPCRCSEAKNCRVPSSEYDEIFNPILCCRHNSSHKVKFLVFTKMATPFFRLYSIC